MRWSKRSSRCRPPYFIDVIEMKVDLMSLPAVPRVAPCVVFGTACEITAADVPDDLARITHLSARHPGRGIDYSCACAQLLLHVLPCSADRRKGPPDRTGIWIWRTRRPGFRETHGRHDGTAASGVTCKGRSSVRIVDFPLSSWAEHFFEEVPLLGRDLWAPAVEGRSGCVSVAASSAFSLLLRDGRRHLHFPR